MKSEARRLRKRSPRRRRTRSALIALAILAGCPTASSAQEPLYIRIRPPPVAAVDREALWARRQAHARAVIASVCTGCLGAWDPPAAAGPSLTGPAPTLAAGPGLEIDRGSGASEPAPESSTPERRP